MFRAPAWALLCLLAAADGLLGCDACNQENNENATLYEAGQTSSDCARYETNAFDAKYVHFPAGRRLRVMHGLGQLPTEVHSYLAFSADALREGDTAESAGNQVLIEAVTPDYVQVRNDTCEEFHLRLVVEAPASAACTSTATGGGAGGSPG